MHCADRFSQNMNSNIFISGTSIMYALPLPLFPSPCSLQPPPFRRLYPPCTPLYLHTHRRGIHIAVKHEICAQVATPSNHYFSSRLEPLLMFLIPHYFSRLPPVSLPQSYIVCFLLASHACRLPSPPTPPTRHSAVIAVQSPEQTENRGGELSNNTQQIFRGFQ